MLVFSSDFLELNEASLIDKEFTIRDMRLTKEVLETKRSAIRWLALSLGILNPGESRLSSVAILDALIYFQFIKNTDADVKQMIEYINKQWEPINEKTLRYHLLRMKRMGFVENAQGKFYFKKQQLEDSKDINYRILYLFESNYKDVANKVGEVIKELKNRNLFEV